MKRVMVMMGVLAVLGVAQAGAATDHSAEGATSPTAAKFFRTAASGGMAELELGKLASERGSSSAVKQFGQQMVDDHSKANDELQAVAAKKGIALPNGLDAKSAALRDRLSRESGSAFNRSYMSAMVADHKEDVTEFQTAAKSSDPDVKGFASKTLPTLQDHLKQAKAVQKSL